MNVTSTETVKEGYEADGSSVRCPSGGGDDKSKTIAMTMEKMDTVTKKGRQVDDGHNARAFSDTFKAVCRM